MAIEIKEYVGHNFVSVNQKLTTYTNMTEGYAETYISEDSIMVEIEAIHSRVTRNNTYYSPECLKESVKYWTYPYERPVIMHHNEKDGQIIGRVKAVEYTETNTRGNTPALVFTANVGNEEGKKGIKNGTLSTVSIGVIAHDLRCSICGTNLAEEGLCEHEKGEFYKIDGENKLCYWIINKMEPKEVSYVIVPSDAYAHNIRVYDAVKKKKSEVNESVEYNNPFAELIEATKVKEPTEGKQIDEEIKDKETDIPEESKSEETNEAPEQTEEEVKLGEDKLKEEPEKEESKEGEDSTEKTESEESKEEAAESTEKENKELEAANEKIVELEKEIKALKDKNSKLENKLEKVTETKESVERELVQFKAERKKQLVEQVSNLRSQLSLPKEDETTLLESSEEFLKSTIKSLTEFTQVQKTAFGLQTISSPVAISESKDNTTHERTNKIRDVKESSHKSNKNLEEQFTTIMNELF